MTKESNDGPLTYAAAGVDIDAGNALVENIKSVARATQRPGVLSGLGGFGALFELPSGYREPVLVSGTDGVGTKLRLAIELQRHTTVGIDLVAMCVNDLIVCGAEPLYFLDYYATAKLDVATASDVVSGIGEGCIQSGCALIGGETAEMPGMYEGSDYDLAGFCVGIVEKSEILDGSAVKAGDKLVALSSSGPHSNGYSLIRKILEVTNSDLNEQVDGKSLADQLMSPTKIYVKSVLPLVKNAYVSAMAHITGGGLTENIPRVLPAQTKALIDRQSWTMPPIFNWLQEQGQIEVSEMNRTFNCGVGMVLAVPEEHSKACIDALQQSGETAFIIGEISHSDSREPHVEYC